MHNLGMIAVDSEGCAYLVGSDGVSDDAVVNKLSSSGSSLIFSTYLGGSGEEYGGSIEVDSSKNVYITGTTNSSDFPLSNPYQASSSSQDAFVSKLSSSGSSLLFSTYLGGSGLETAEFGLDVDLDNCVYITGTTYSSDFPISNSYQSSLEGEDDAFVTKLSSSGSFLLYSTYLGGSNSDGSNDIAVSLNNNPCLSGRTTSIDFPTKNPYQAYLKGGFSGDAFVTMLSSSGSELVFSTYLGGRSDEIGGLGIDMDSAGSAYVTGITQSEDFPTENPYQASLNGSDAYIAKFSSTGSLLVYSTFLGGSIGAGGHGVKVDITGSAYVTGYTTSIDFPTNNPYQASFGGTEDAFIAKLSPSGSSLVFSSFLGGSGDENSMFFSLDIDFSNCVYVAGYTASIDFPTKNPYQASLVGYSDLFVSKLRMSYLGTPTPPGYKTPFPTPTPTLSPTPTPDYCVQPLLVSHIEDASLAQLRSDESNGFAWAFFCFDYNDPDHRFGWVLDDGNTWSDHNTFPASPPLKLKIYNNTRPTDVRDGDYVTIEYDGGKTLDIYPPPLSNGTGIYYVSDTGNTYYDIELCSLAKAVPTFTPTPTMTPIPTMTLIPTSTSIPTSPPTATPSVTPSVTPSPLAIPTPPGQTLLLEYSTYLGGERL